MDPAFQRHHWSAEDEKAEPEEWICPSADRNRQFTRIPGFTVPPAVALAMEKIVGTKNFPYEVSADLIRHALSRHIEWLSRQDDRAVPPHLIALIRQMNMLRHDEVLKRESVTNLAKLEHVMERLIQDGDRAHAFRYGVAITRLIEQMDASATKQKFHKRFTARYHRFIRSGGHVLPDATAGYVVTDADLAEVGLERGMPTGEVTGDGEGEEWVQ